MNLIDEFLTPSLRPSHKYYWRNRISRHHISRMLSLAPLERLMGDVNGKPDPRYLMYRVETLLSPDGGRRYEFLIEYDIYNPSQGIYFGCKSVTMPEHRHSRELSLANDDWQHVRPHAMLRLNNIFIDKDFTYRFQDTDNANDNTYWPFWISLYEDEDPQALAVRALSTIAAAYRQLFEGTLPKISGKIISNEKNVTRTAFTKEAYSRLRESIQSYVRVASSPSKGDVTLLPKQLRAWQLFEDFLAKAEEEGILHKVDYYEYAWMLDNCYSDIDFKCMMTLLFQQLSHRLDLESIRIPWSSLIGIFLHSDGTPFKLQIKTLNPTASTRRLWSTLLPTI